MNRMDRLTAIIIWLQTTKCLPAHEIANRYGISLRTVYRDIRALEDGGVPIGAEPGRGYFLAKGFHLPPVMFTRSEAGALVLGAKFLEQYSDQRVTAQYAAALDKIKAVLGTADQEYVNRLDNQVTVLNATPPPFLNDANSLLTELQPALADSRVLRLTYLSGSKGETTRRNVEPLGLCFYGGHWHLMAYCQLRKDYRDFRVNRIAQVLVLGELFHRGRHADLKELIKRIMGGLALTPATVTFTAQAAQSMGVQKYYFGFINERRNGTGIEMDFLVPDLHYLATWLLSFTDQVIVLSPPGLIRHLKTLVSRLSAHYPQTDELPMVTDDIPNEKVAP